MKIISVDQGTKEWKDWRRKIITGTKLKKVMGTKNDQLELISELIAEAGTGQTKQVRVTEKMQRGTDEEPMAIKAFENKTGKKVKSVGFCISDEFDFLGLSPDGFIEENTGYYTEGVEIKNPDSSTLISYKIANLVESKEVGITPAKLPFLGIPAEYKWQTIDYFLVNEKLRKLYFAVCDERFINSDMKMYIVELNRENEVLQLEIDNAKKTLVEFREKWLKWESIVLLNGF